MNESNEKPRNLVTDLFKECHHIVVSYLLHIVNRMVLKIWLFLMATMMIFSY